MPDAATPAVSVIVPVFNVERYLAECLDSLVAQTHTDFEVVVVDDGSTDGSSDIVGRYADEFPELVRSFRKPNGGLADARNFGMEHARGAYFAFVDGDDAVVPTMLERMHDRALSTGAELVICGIENFFDGATSGVYYPEPDMSVFGHSLAQEPRLVYRVDASACDKLYSRTLFERSGLRFPVGMRFEDVPTTYRLLPFANLVEKIDAPLYRYRHQRSTSITGVYDLRFLELVEGFRLINEAYTESGIFDATRGALLRLHLTHLIAGRYPDLFANAAPKIRSRFIARAYAHLDGWFAGWRRADACRELWPNPILRFVSTHSLPLTAFCSLPARAYFGVLARLGGFDPSR